MKPNEDKKKSSMAAKKSHKKSAKKHKREDSDYNDVVSSEKFTIEHCLKRNYCIPHRKCNHSTNCKDLQAMVNKHKQKQQRSF